MRASLAVSFGLWLLVGCTAEPRGLTVDVRTDLAPVAEFARVQTEVLDHPFAGPETLGMVASVPADATRDYTRGVRVDELPTLASGPWYVRVSLLDARSGVLLRRTTAITLTGRYALTVVLTRSCEGVVCPGALDPVSHTECNGGRCVSPFCSPSDPSTCAAPACTTDRQCDRGACGIGTCAGGACLVTPSTTACGAAVCGPDFGCTAADAGPSPDGGGMPDASTADAGSDAGPCSPPAACTASASNCHAMCVGGLNGCIPICGGNTACIFTCEVQYNDCQTVCTNACISCSASAGCMSGAGC